LYRRSPGKALAMTLFLASLAGIPLTAGFIGKYYILMGAIDAHLYGLAAIMVITTVISYYYYFGLAVQMYMREPAQEKPLAAPASLKVVLAICLGGTLLLGLFPQVALDLIQTRLNVLDLFLPYSS
jgi:NADH-quinone oxidoreductase subunit N